ncbi:MAG: helix-turn-helix transcriptional regulator [Flavobacteriaceae bacterium]|nr:helix-turn-helix transcriptional regulator [Flavobacteriaceae bacterium]
MTNNFRSDCPIACTLDILGDKWSLLLVRDMLVQGKKTFKDFSNSSEKIAPGILSARLKWLEENELLTKRKLPNNDKENIYLLTEKGITIAPIITEIVLWSSANINPDNPVSGMIKEKSKFSEGVQNNYREMVRSLIG